MSLKTYVPDWLGFDRGREGVLVGPLWKGVLDILAKHEGEDYYNYESPLYEELEQEFPEESWIGGRAVRMNELRLGAGMSDGATGRRQRQRGQESQRQRASQRGLQGRGHKIPGALRVNRAKNQPR